MQEFNGDAPDPARRWETLEPEEQTRLRVAYGRYLDQLPPSCSLEEKNRRFARWLAEEGVLYGAEQYSGPA
jgi:hypothetical protein